MAATAESMIASLDAGPSEGGGEAPASAAALISDTPASTEAPAQDTQQPAAPAGGEPQQPAAAAAAAQPKDSPEDIQRKHLAALHEARGEAKTLRQQLAEVQQQLAALKNPQQQPPAAEQPEQEPDFLADPKGYVDKKVQAALAKLDATEKKTTETAEQIKQREANEAVLRATQSAETEFYSKTPDYPQALQHIRGVRTQQLQSLFPDATPDQINNHIAFEERETARLLVQQGRNPAEFAYNFARTLGYAKAATQPAKTTPPPADKDAVRTLGSGGGSGAPTEDAGNTMPEFSAALAERFKPKKR